MKRSSLLLATIGLGFVFFTTGCALHLNNDRLAGGFRYSKGAEKNLGEDNFALLAKKYQQEWRLNRSAKEAPPALGIAMSGGGMRSAAFNIGVLMGLYEGGVLDRLDIMSSVSGGGYALSWYYLQRYAGASDAELFDPDGRFQRHLVENGRIITHSKNRLIRGGEYLVKAGANVFSLPFHWLANGLFDWNLNLAPYRVFYQNAIEREFHLTPSASGRGYENAGRFLGLTVGVKKEVTFPAMRAFIEKAHLPSFVINTTARISDSMDHLNADFANSVFEFTPFAYGSDGFGYFERNFPIDIHTAVAVSGAAADSSIMPAKLGFAFSAINTDLGYSISNPNVPLDKALRHKVLPVPFYFFYRDNDDIRNPDIYLTDGGHSENLGAFALVRRMCKKIIIVDAEHDPDYRFLAYRKLKKHLAAELGVDFSLPAIEQGLLVKRLPVAEAASLTEDDTLTPELAAALGLGKGAVASYDETARAWMISSDTGRLQARREGGELKLYRPYDGSIPVMRGKISWFPLTQNGTPERVDLQVVYIKLSLDPSHLENYPRTVRDYFNKKPGWFNRLTHASRFPHEETSDISYDPQQFAAYRDLGRHLAKAWKAGGGI